MPFLLYLELISINYISYGTHKRKVITCIYMESRFLGELRIIMFSFHKKFKNAI